MMQQGKYLTGYDNFSISQVGQKLQEISEEIRELRGSQKDFYTKIDDISGRLDVIQSELNRSGKSEEQAKLNTDLMNLRKAIEDKKREMKKKEMNRQKTYHSNEDGVDEPPVNTEYAEALLQETDYKRRLLESREEQFRDMHGQIVDIRDMTSDINVLLNQQTGTLEMEQNTLSTVQNADKGVVQLKKADKYDRKARKKTCCIALIVVIVVAIAVVVVVLVL
ncbi:MAG: hypothetical protein EZS28_002695 [Streblomastix strix]|uniref:t-SNARE coiled-coil homology domain-containing protein n=1 Tax=Streblomastix strix TaxID=222440 RepID=A0A5J4X479_9EUKA|nr:MAG: hypothetical protein EZS28_002695 [Streblomastix strix]